MGSSFGRCRLATVTVAGTAPATIVTGDRHLLKLKQLLGTAIVRLADFLRLFPDEE